jgi:hypothetical protein
MPPAAPMRAFLGFIAGAISLLIFHQGMLEVLHFAGAGPPAWSVQPVPPFGIPRVVDLCFWAGLWGALFGLLLPRFTWPLWLCGILLGFAAAAVAWFVVAPLKGLPIASGWVPINLARSLLINGFYGLGVGLILPLLMPRSIVRVHT